MSRASGGANRQVQSDRPIFVMGCQRSGTTLVSQLLSNHSRIALYHESFFYHIFYPERRYYGDLRRVRNLERLVTDLIRIIRLQRREITASRQIFDATPQEILNRIESSSFEGAIAAVYQLYASRYKKERGGDKTPENFRYLNEIQQGFPNSPIVYLMRDPRDTILSSARQFKTSLERGALMWNDAFSTMTNAKKPVHLIRYEELVTEPERVLTELCRNLGGDYEPQMLNFFRRLPAAFTGSAEHSRLLDRPISNDSVGSFKKLPTDDIRKIESWCAEGMRTMEYEFTQHSTPSSFGSRAAKSSSISETIGKLRYFGVDVTRWRHGWARWQLMLRARVRYYSGMTWSSTKSFRGNGDA